MLIAAQSGRILAAAARRAGYAPLVADFYGDDDTSALAARTVRLPARLNPPALLQALDRLSEGLRPIGLAYGSGFESQPGLLDAAAERHVLLGNAAGTVRRLKDPPAFTALCRDCAVPHPAVAALPPKGASEGEWLEKRAGGTGGAHVRPARPGRVRLPRYVQRRIAGEPVSALFLADGRRALVLGFSAQWATPAPGQPFRFGGVAQPARLDPALASAMAASVQRLVAVAGLVGLNAADFLVRPEGPNGRFDLLEINPRAGASLDVFEAWSSAARTKVVDARNKSGHDDLGGADGNALFGLHVAACHGRLPASALPSPLPAASAVAYARQAITLPPGFAWPDWSADRQKPGRPAPEGMPFCTVLASANDADAARALAMQRVGIILGMAETA